MTGLIIRIARFAVHDGPGIRTTVFLKGCPLRCWWCHSPESQSRLPELELRADRCLDCGACHTVCPEQAIDRGTAGWVTDRARCRACGRCVDACPAGARELSGTAYTPDQLAAEIEKDTVFFDESGGGVTFSGGEPLMQPDFLEAMLGRTRAAGIHAAVDTCGYASREVVDRIAPLADLFLFDLKQIDDGRHREATGVSNVPILENFARLAMSSVPLRVRLPLIPGVNDTPADVDAVGRFVSRHGVAYVDVLPYHRAGLAKYVRFGVATAPGGAEPLAPDRIDETVERLRAFGLIVQVGG